MPTITVQVGQCGNQLGQAYWDSLYAQSGVSGGDPLAHCEYFKHTPSGAKQARCVLVDTEPKVVGGALSGDRHGLFNRSRCFLGQSGRGNNWAFGYRQLAPKTDEELARAAQRAERAGWNHSTALEDPNQQEFRILEHVFEGIRCEVEECDGAPNFLLLHSLGGGSGSGMGSRILEHLREEYPLTYIATGSVVPRSAGETPMQAINSVMAMSFLQTYVDAVLLFNNQDLLESASKRDQAGSADLADINKLIAHRLTGCLWPLDGADALRGGGRIRDMVGSVACDPCTKLLETWTAHSHANTPTASLWQDSVKGLHSAAPRYDQAKKPITTAGALLLARGYPTAAVSAATTTAALTAYTKMLGAHAAPLAATNNATLHLRCGATPLLRDPAAHARQTAAGSGASGAAPSLPSAARPSPSLTAVGNRSSTIHLLDAVVHRALSVCQAGAYLHWYAKYGCPKEAIEEAALRMADVSACYRQVHLQQAAPAEGL